VSALTHTHTHYCAEHDLRWTCHTQNCTIHEAAPCKGDAPRLTPTMLADELASAVLDGMTPISIVVEIANKYQAARRA
jgi:hypothetical protein